MPRSYFDRNTPIAASATPEGRSALAVVRTAGANAIELVARCFSNRQALLDAQGYQAVYGWFIDPSSGEYIDEVIALVFRAPHSFTGENAVEIILPIVQYMVFLSINAIFAPPFNTCSFLHLDNGNSRQVQCHRFIVCRPNAIVSPIS